MKPFIKHMARCLMVSSVGIEGMRVARHYAPWIKHDWRVLALFFTFMVSFAVWSALMDER